MSIYKSQIRSWIGLGPALLLRYSFAPFSEGKKLTSLEPGVIGNCFYENRGRAVQRDVLSAHQKFVKNLVLSEK